MRLAAPGVPSRYTSTLSLEAFTHPGHVIVERDFTISVLVVTNA
jgi:hypothetical protein